MDEYLSASAKRAMVAAASWARRTGASQVDPAHLLLAIAQQEESRGATVLSAFGLTFDALRAVFYGDANEPVDEFPPDRSVALSEPVRQVLNRAHSKAVDRGADNPAGTDLLLQELMGVAALRERFKCAGVDVAAIEQQLLHEVEADQGPLAAEFSTLDIADQTDAVDTYRILDACSNRAREGLRVLEDFARFACDDPFLSAQFKAARHDLREALDCLPQRELLASRDTEHDVGTAVTTDAEFSRTSPLDVVLANLKRTQESLRSLEEFGKLESRSLAERVESVRYRIYTLERAMLQGLESQSRLAGAILYVLVSSDHCPAGLDWTVSELLAGGAQMVQLREKARPDREVVELAHRVRQVTRRAGALFIVNDRPDIARLVDADGVHVGQEELSVKDARRIVGPRALVGVSVHSIEQARQAVLDGADYMGVGPTFPSSTKPFASFPGLELVRQVSIEIRLPAFAIGGITPDRVASVIAAGGRRVAVSAAVCEAEEPRVATAELLRHITSSDE
jgi:thiamine-phosphate pyrophosphorylase